jgi:hypothetical protein
MDKPKIICTEKTAEKLTTLFPGISKKVAIYRTHPAKTYVIAGNTISRI